MKELMFFLLGATVGAIAALMFAPLSGTELRAQIRTAAEGEAGRLQADWQTGLQKTNEKLDKLQADLKKTLQQERTASPEQQ
jgi:gas vesicle protein